MGRPTRKDNVEGGVSSTTRMIMTVTTTMTSGGAAEMPDGVGDEFEAPLKRAEAEFGPSGAAAFPPSGSGSSGGGGSQNADDGAE
jgi:hypothetical protein